MEGSSEISSEMCVLVGVSIIHLQRDGFSGLVRISPFDGQMKLPAPCLGPTRRGGQNSSHDDGECQGRSQVSSYQRIVKWKAVCRSEYCKEMLKQQ